MTDTQLGGSAVVSDARGAVFLILQALNAPVLHGVMMRGGRIYEECGSVFRSFRG